ncbi:MAG: PIN domain-containing protein [Bacillota bacterium]
MESYVADTHSLIWFLSEDDRLSDRAEYLLSRAEAAEVEILIPTIVLAEIVYLVQKRNFRVTIEEVLKRIDDGDGFIIVPFDFAIFQTMLRLPTEWEIHDRIIAATGLYYNAAVITKDEVLSGSDQVETTW